MGYVDDTLLDGERIIWRARLHWITLARAIIGAAIVVAFLGDWLERGFLTGLATLAIVIGLLLMLPPLINWLTTEIAVTSRRFVVKRGLVRRAVMEMNAGQLESVRVNQSVLGRLLGYGTVIVGGTGSGVDPIKNVDDPLTLRKAIGSIARR